MEQETIEAGKTAAITSYILIIGALIALSMNAETKNQYAAFHIRQALGIAITFIGLGLIISNFNSFMIAVPMWICTSVLWTYGIISAIQGTTKPMPLVGTWYQKWFKNVA